MARLIVTMGAPGAGKSTWAAPRFAHVVSTDALRAGAATQRVFRASFKRLAELLAEDRDVCFDTTAEHPATRAHALDVARRHEAWAALAVMATPLEICIARQAARQHPVAEARVREIHFSIERQLPRVFAEGWDAVVVVGRGLAEMGGPLAGLFGGAPGGVVSDCNRLLGFSPGFDLGANVLRDGVFRVSLLERHKN